MRQGLLSTHRMVSFMRYLLTLFPVFILLTELISNRWARAFLVVIFGLTQMFLWWSFLQWMWVV